MESAKIGGGVFTVSSELGQMNCRLYCKDNPTDHLDDRPFSGLHPLIDEDCRRMTKREKLALPVVEAVRRQLA
jgi:hypothetical protein